MNNNQHYTIDILGQECEVIEATFGTSAFGRHFHDVFSIGLVEMGVNAFNHRRKRVEAGAGSICIADAGEVHDGGLSGASWAYKNIFLPPELLDKLWKEDGGQRQPNFNCGIVDETLMCRVMSLLFSTFVNESDQSTRDEAAILAFGTLLRRFGAESLASERMRKQSVAERAVEMISDMKGTGLSLDDLSRETDVSRYAVIRAVSGATGLTPTGLMLQTRVNHAKRLVRSGTLLADAALDAGFSDQAHFTREMKKRWGITPGKLEAALQS